VDICSKAAASFARNVRERPRHGFETAAAGVRIGVPQDEWERPRSWPSSRPGAFFGTDLTDLVLKLDG
jgi:hypothetical protein